MSKRTSMTSQREDLAVIGSGPAGQKVAVAAKPGKRAAIGESAFRSPAFARKLVALNGLNKF
jgi:hypothetical protein